MVEGRDVRIERSVYTNRGSPEKQISYQDLDPSPKAIEISGGIRGIVTGVEIDAARDTVNKSFDPEDDFKNFEDLKRIAGGPEMSKEELERLFPDPILLAEYIRKRQIYFDLIDGVAIGSMWGNGFGVGSEFKNLIKKDGVTGDEVDEFLGLKPELKGVGQALLDSVITDGKLIKLLDMMQMTVNRSGSDNDPSYYDRWMAEVRKVVMGDDGEDWNSPPLSEAEMVITYLSSIAGGARIEAEMRSRRSVEVPSSVEEQYRVARFYMDRLEGGGFRPTDITATEFSGPLSSMLQDERLDPEVAKEIIGRLHLRMVYECMYTASGFLGEGNRNSIENQLQEAHNAKLDLTGRDMEFFLKGNSSLSRVTRGAWNMFQEMNWGDGYEKLLKKIVDDKEFLSSAGIVFTSETENQFLTDDIGFLNQDSKYWDDQKSNYTFDDNIDRKEIVRKYMAYKLKNELGVDDYEATKGVELADQLIVATGEDAVFAAAFPGHHDLAEALLTEGNTADRQGKSKTTGSREMTTKLISLGTTWLRYVSGRSVFGPLMADEINTKRIDRAKGGIYFWYTAIVPKKLIPIKEAMMNEEGPFKGIDTLAWWKNTSERLDKVAKYESVILDEDNQPIITPGLDTVDSKGRPIKIKIEASGSSGEKEKIKETAKKKSDRLRELLVLSVAQLASTRPEWGWSKVEWENLKDTLTRPVTISEKGVTKLIKPFVSLDVFTKIEKETPVLSNFDKLASMRAANKNGVPKIVDVKWREIR